MTKLWEDYNKYYKIEQAKFVIFGNFKWTLLKTLTFIFAKVILNNLRKIKNRKGIKISFLSFGNDDN
jgi:hypothetical protein